MSRKRRSNGRLSKIAVARTMIEGADDLARLVNGPGRSEANQRVLLQAQLTSLANRVPDLGETA